MALRRSKDHDNAGGRRTHAAAARRAAGLLMAVGGLAWIVKVLMIVGNEGTNTGDGAVGVAFILGVATMAGGFALAGVWAAWRMHPLVRVIGAVIGLVAFFVLFALLDSLAKTVLGDVGRSYMEDEWGIVVTGAAVIVLGALLVLGARRRGPPGDAAGG